jgi:hypothetical protein
MPTQRIPAENVDSNNAGVIPKRKNAQPKIILNQKMSTRQHADRTIIAPEEIWPNLKSRD